MIELLLKLVDRIIQLRQFRSDYEKDVFEKIYEPLFKDLTIIHQNYLQFFEEAYSSFVNNEIDWNNQDDLRSITIDAVRQLKKDRLEYETFRVNSRKLLNHLLEEASSEFSKKFVLSVSRYFPSAHLLDHRSTISWSTRSLDELKSQYEKDNINHEFIKDYLEGTLANIRSKWDDISNHYARLKLSVYSPN